MMQRNVKRGDIVLVRLHFSHKWHPALVLASNDLGVKVTLSSSQNDAVSLTTTTYFSESQVLPFEDFFPSLISNNRHAPLLHSALRLLGQTLISALRCPCLMGHNQAQWARHGSGFPAHFDPVGVLGFVLDAAFSPSVEPSRFAIAVKFVAQVHAFRSYSSFHHKKTYQQTLNTGDNMKLLPSSSLGQKMHSVTQESVALEPKEICQTISKKGEKNIVFGTISRLNSKVLGWEENSKHLFKKKLLLISDNLMLSPCLDPLYMVRESLKSERQSLLGFKSMSDQGIVDICFGNSSTMSEIHISVPSNFKIHLSNYINKREENALGVCCRFPDAETTIYLNRKRRRLDKLDSFHVFPQEDESDAYIPKHSRPRISDIKLLEQEGNIQKDHRASTCFSETTMDFTEEVQKVDFRSQNSESLSNLVPCFHYDKSEADASESMVKGMLGSDLSVYQERLHMICNNDTVKLKRSARTELSSVQKVNLDRIPNCKSLSNLELHFHSDKFAVDTTAVKDMLGSDSSVYQEGLQMSCKSNTTPLKSKRCARITLSSGDCLVEGKDCYEGVASCLPLDSEVGQPSKSHVPFSPKSLYMKFPVNFNLPSKEQLIKKFCVFGRVDPSRTRVFCHGGSAQVAFLHELDAVAAYQYVKRKTWFGEANVRFWLDPFEHKRSGFKCFAHLSQSTTLKSCLRNSKSRRQENKKQHRRVRFLVPSASKQIGPPLKSCLKNSNSLKQENRKKHRRVRFTIET